MTQNKGFNMDEDYYKEKAKEAQNVINKALNKRKEMDTPTVNITSRPTDEFTESEAKELEEQHYYDRKPQSELSKIREELSRFRDELSKFRRDENHQVKDSLDELKEDRRILNKRAGEFCDKIRYFESLNWYERLFYMDFKK